MRNHMRHVERALAGYFGASTVTADVPLLGETVPTLQAKTRLNADAITRATLFPELTAEQQQKLSRVLRGDVSDQPTVRAPHITAEHRHEDAALLHGGSRSAAQRVAAREAYDFRVLSNRFASVLDSNKEFGMGEEIPYDELVRDVHSIWSDASAACASLHHHCEHKTRTQTASGTTLAVPLRIVFVVAYAHTHGVRGVGETLCDIQNRVTARVHHHHHRGPLSSGDKASGLSSVLRVVPIRVGIQQRSDAPRQAHAAEGLSYPHGGFYTLNALLRIIQSLPAVQVAPNPSVLDVARADGKRVALQHDTFILSDSWLHPRTMALMHAQPADGSTMAIVPGVVSDALSEREVEAFARFVVSQIRHL